MRRKYEGPNTYGVLRTTHGKGYPHGLNTIYLTLPDGDIFITIKEDDNNLARWLWKLITDDLKRELKEAE